MIAEATLLPQETLKDANDQRASASLAATNERLLNDQKRPNLVFSTPPRPFPAISEPRRPFRSLPEMLATLPLLVI